MKAGRALGRVTREGGVGGIGVCVKGVKLGKAR